MAGAALAAVVAFLATAGDLLDLLHPDAPAGAVDVDEEQAPMPEPVLNGQVPTQKEPVK